MEEQRVFILQPRPGRVCWGWLIAFVLAAALVGALAYLGLNR